MRWIKSGTIIVAVTFIFFEISSFVLTKVGVFFINDTPRLYQSHKDIPDIAYGRTEKDPWGAWHVSSGTYLHSKSCFSVEMSFNEVGARDESFANLPSNTLMLLGDSFAEGYGVSYEDTSQFIIEKKLGVQVANMGTSGNFGPLQELMLYRAFQYLPHDGLLVYVLPANDFTDNDATVWSDITKTRYRPYFGHGEHPLTPLYFPEAQKRNTFLDQNSGWLKQFIKNTFWSSNALRSALLLADNTYISPTQSHIVESFFMMQIANNSIILLQRMHRLLILLAIEMFFLFLYQHYTIL